MITKRNTNASIAYLLWQHKCHIIGVDVKPGRNVDVVMKQPYRLPLRRNCADVTILARHSKKIYRSSGYLSSNSPGFLRPGGYPFLTLSSRGHVHDVYDCWRHYPDCIRALGAFSGLAVIEARTDFPPAVAGRRHHDYGQVGHSMSYWGDTVVLRKPAGRRSIAMMAARGTLRWWANRIGDLDEAAPVGAKRQASPAVLAASTLP